MLVLTRKSNQSIMIGDDIEVSVLAIMGEKVRIGIQAPRDIPVFCKEVYFEVQQERVGTAGRGAREGADPAAPGLGETSEGPAGSPPQADSAEEVVKGFEHRVGDDDRRRDER